MQVVRQAAGGISEVWDLPDLFPEAGERRTDSGGEKGELVREGKG